MSSGPITEAIIWKLRMEVLRMQESTDTLALPPPHSLVERPRIYRRGGGGCVHWCGRQPCIPSQSPAHLRQDTTPQELPMTTHHKSCSMCTDPFFQLGGQQVKPDEDTVPRTWQPSTTRWLNNGCHARHPGIPRNHSSFDSQPI